MAEFKSLISEVISRSGHIRKEDYQVIQNEVGLYYEDKLLENGVFSSPAEYSKFNAASWQIIGEPQALSKEERLSDAELDEVRKDSRIQLAVEMLRLSLKLFEAKDIYTFDDAVANYEQLLNAHVERPIGELEFRVLNHLRERSEFARNLVDRLKTGEGFRDLKPGTAEHAQWMGIFEEYFGSRGADSGELQKEGKTLEFKPRGGEKLR